MPHRGSEMESILIILVAAGYAESLVPRRCASCPLAGQLVLGRGHVQLFCFSIFFTLSRNHVFGGPQLWANFVTLPHVFIQHVLQYMVTALMGCIDPATAHRQACRLSRQIAPEQRQEWVVGMAMSQNSSKFCILKRTI